MAKIEKPLYYGVADPPDFERYDVQAIYGWEEDMEQEYCFTVVGPMTEERRADPNGLPDLLVIGDRTYVYKRQNHPLSGPAQLNAAYAAGYRYGRQELPSRF